MPNLFAYLPEDLLAGAIAEPQWALPVSHAAGVTQQEWSSAFKSAADLIVPMVASVEATGDIDDDADAALERDIRMPLSSHACDYRDGPRSISVSPIRSATPSGPEPSS